ncbi:hypothetical protein F4678DRAFT_411547 [Xylaria arbuscula]|nr:hypothetical protein F4678DRAFT_411547 [Xylaria arbuscula]
MSALTEFSLFKNLPAELRSLVWEIAILDHNRDRIVPIFHQNAHKIVCIRTLVCSPHFFVCWESRQVAKLLYPLRFRVSQAFDQTSHYSLLSVEERQRLRLSFPQWAVYISFKHDIFALLNYQTLFRCHQDEIGCIMRPPLNYSSFGRVAQGSLTPEQCRSVERVVQFGSMNKLRLKDKCRGKLSCAVRCGAMEYRNNTFDRDTYSGIKRCFHALWTADLSWYTMVRYSENRLLENLEANNCLIEVDEADMKELQKQDKALKCLCG